MFKLKELICKVISLIVSIDAQCTDRVVYSYRQTNVLKTSSSMQYFPIAFKKRFKNTDTPTLEGKVVRNESKPLVNHCMMLSYSGTKYYGIQRLRQEGAPTIEEVLFKAMLDNKWITDEAFEQPFSIRFQQGSRTDKGVSAVRQCCSIRLREL